MEEDLGFNYDEYIDLVFAEEPNEPNSYYNYISIDTLISKLQELKNEGANYSL